MSTENLNDFYNSNKFNQKLRSRIDQFEPELSNSLWDRIEHDLEGKETKNRRVLRLVYLLSALLLVSMVGMYYLADQNKKLADNIEAVKSTSSSPSVNGLPSNETTGDITPYQPAPQAEANASPDVTETSSPAASVTDAGKVNTPNSTINPNSRTSTPLNGITVPSPDETSVSPGSAEPAEMTETPVAPITTVTQRPFQTTTALPQGNLFIEKTAKPVHTNDTFINSGKIKTHLVNFFVGGFAGAGISNTKASGPNAANFFFESPVNRINTNLNLGIIIKDKISISTGAGYYQTGEKLSYSLRPKPSSDPTMPIAYSGDTLRKSDTVRNINTQSWIEIPLLVTYRYSLGNRWFVNAGIGASYSMILSAEGSQANQGFGAIEPLGSGFGKPVYKNHFNMLGTAGIGYRLNSKFTLNAGINYRKAITSITNTNHANIPERYASFTGGSLGFTYTFR